MSTRNRTTTLRGRTPRQRARAEERATRDDHVVALAVAGLPVRTIAERVGLSKTQAASIVRRELKQRAEERAADTAAAVALEADRLDAMHARVWPHALAGDLAAIDAVLRIMDRRARLFGLYVDPTTPHADPADAYVLKILTDRTAS